MKQRRTWLWIIVIGLLLLGAAGGAGVVGWQLSRAAAEALPPAADQAGLHAQPEEESTAGTTVAADPAFYERGVLVTAVDPEGPAAAAGVRRGTIVLALDGDPVDSFDTLKALLEPFDGGETIALTVLNGPEETELAVTLAAEPPLLGLSVSADCGCGLIFHGAPADGNGIPRPGAGEFEFSFPVTAGLRVGTVLAGTPAADAGLVDGDLITAIDDTPIHFYVELVAALSQYAPGDRATLTVQREEETLALAVTLGVHPEDDARAYLGVRPTSEIELPGPWSSPRGIPSRTVVLEVLPDTPAAAAGLEQGDLLLSADGTSLTDAADLLELLAQRAPGDTLSLEILRGDETMTLPVTLGDHPDDPGRAFLGLGLATFGPSGAPGPQGEEPGGAGFNFDFRTHPIPLEALGQDA